MDFIRVFYDPLKINHNTKRWIFYFVIAFILLYVTLFLNFHFHYNDIIKSMSDRLSSLSPEQREQAMRMLTKKVLLTRSAIGIGFASILQLLFLAGVFYIVLLFFGQETFGISLLASSVYLYIHSVGGLLNLILSLLFHTFPFRADFSLFYAGEGFFKGFLSSLNFYSIYGLVIAGFVLKKDEKKSRLKVILVLLLLLLLWALIIGIVYSMRLK